MSVVLPNEAPMPQEVYEYLLGTRLLTDASIQQFCKYCIKGGYGWLAFPVKKDGQVLYYKLRSAPGNPAPNKAAFEPSGQKAELFGSGVLHIEGVNRVFICEGELDCILMLQHDFPAVTSTAGAMTFEEDWCHMFPKGCEVVLCFDNDDAGEKGREKVRKLFQKLRPDVAISDIRFGEFETKGFDISDFFLHCKVHGIEDARAALLSRVSTDDTEKEKEGASVERKIVEVPTPTKELSLQEWKETIQEYFPTLSHAAETCASIYAQLLIHDVHNPFGLVVTDAPSTGKTICLNFFSDIENISYTTDTFTSAAFVSNIAGRSKEQLEKIDLLPRIRYKTLLVREMATMLTESDDAIRQRLGQLTRVLDGEGYQVESGVYGQRGYRGEYNFMFIAASTPFPLRVWKLMSGLGHRLFFLGIHSKQKNVSDLMAQSSGVPFKRKETICKAATESLIYTLWKKHPEGIKWDYSQDDKESMEWIAKFAILLTKLRGEIIVFKEYHAGTGAEIASTVPRIEDPSRAFTCLLNLARGHAVLSGRTGITREDAAICLPVVLDTAAEARVEVMRYLLNNNGKATAYQLTHTLHMPRSSAEKEAEKFVSLGICEGEMEHSSFSSEWDDESSSIPGSKPKNTIEIAKEFKWLIEDEWIIQLLEAFGILD